MGKMNIRELLEKENDGSSRLDLNLVADALDTYREAQKNIAERGSVCAHPRTGAPMENPYVKVRTQQVTILSKFRHIRTDETIRLLDLSLEMEMMQSRNSSNGNAT